MSAPSPSTPDWPHTCDAHAQVPAWAVCTRCGRFVCRDCHRAATGTRFALCPRCARPADLAARRPEAGTDTPRDGASDPPVDTEPRHAHEFFGTVWRVLFGPTRFFSGLAERGRLLPAQLFGVVCSVLGTAGMLGWAMLLEGQSGMLLEASAETGLSPQLAFVAFVLVLPLRGLLQVWMLAIALYGMLRIQRVEGASLNLTARIAGYALVSQVLLLVPPPVGPFLSLFALMSLLMIAVRRALDVPFERTLIAVLVSVLIFMFLGG